MSTNLASLTTLTPTVLCSVQLTSTAATAVYTVPTTTAAIIKHGTLCNVTGTAVTVTLAVVPSGGAVDGTHRVLNSYSLAANDTLPLTDYLGNCHLGAGDSINVTAGTANALDIVLTGLVST